jgi:hypothetical protein
MVYDHAYRARHSLKLNWYLVSLPKHGLTGSNLNYDQTAIFRFIGFCGQLPADWPCSGSNPAFVNARQDLWLNVAGRLPDLS